MTKHYAFKISFKLMKIILLALLFKLLKLFSELKIT